MKNHYHIVGAFDRHNYGDILFPMVHTEFIRAHDPDARISYWAITAADMSSHGGYLTGAVKNLLALPSGKQDVVVLCGGDILSADWLLMVGHVSASGFMKLSRVARRLFGVTRTNDAVKRLLGQRNAFPYVISHNNTDAKVFYTAVGGAGFKAGTDSEHLQRVAAELQRIDGISVRDREIQGLLAGKAVQARLVPDTALVMSKYFTPERLKQRDWKALLEVHGDFNEQAYYSFQGAKRLLEGKEEQLAQQLERIHAATGLSPMFVPIGRAPDHEDHVPLRKIFDLVKARGIPCAYQDSWHVLDIMASLAFAQSYIGTSLHGAITTYAFGHKVSALFCNEVKKLKDFLNTWMQPGDYALLETSDFEKEFSKLIASGSVISDLSGLESNQNRVFEELGRYV